jgi:hypothetical protein
MENPSLKVFVARPRVTVSFSEEIHQYLADRAEREVRSVANLVEYLVVKALKIEQETEQEALQPNESGK